MQSVCSNCHQPVPAGAAFCGNCGALQHLANQTTPTRITPPQPGAPAPIDTAPTRLQPPPAPLGVPPASDRITGQSNYGAQYPVPPGGVPAPPQYSGPAGTYPPPPVAGPPAPGYAPPPPGYVPGAPPPAARAVPSYAQTPKKSGTKHFLLGCLVVVLLVALLGGGGYLVIKKLTSSATSSSSGSTNEKQTLANINRRAIYAGVNITILSATEDSSLPQYQPYDSSKNALGIQARIDDQAPDPVDGSNIAVVGADGNTYAVEGSNNALPSIWDQGIVATGYWFFEVPPGNKIGNFKLVLGSVEEVPVTTPLTGPYDPNQWQQVTHHIGQTVTYDNRQLQGTVTQVVTGIWTSGYQAPKHTRFLLMYLHVVNNTAEGLNVGDVTPPQYLLLFPNGDRHQPELIYGPPINTIVEGGESKDVGDDTFLIPAAPAPYTIIFLNSNGSTAGQVKLGTI